MPFETQVTVRFREVDRAGIAFFGQVFDYCHVAYEELLARMFDPIDIAFGREGWGTPVVHAEADFRRPMCLGDRLTVAMELERLGRRSVTFSYRVSGPDDDERAAVRIVHAFADMAAMAPCDVPEAFTAGLKRLGLLD